VNYQILLDKEQSVQRKTTLASLEHGSETYPRILTTTDNRVDPYCVLPVFGVPHTLTSMNYPLFHVHYAVITR
jgi:hypothetical protein